MKLYIQAIFNSIDGESNGFQGAGQLCTFIRLKGCNLKCSFCDTDYARKVDIITETPMDFEEIINWPDMLEKVTITGGEPLIQSACEKLIHSLMLKKKQVTIETNGSVILSPIHKDLDEYYHLLRYVVDYKLPSSGMEGFMQSEVFAGLRTCDIVKFVIADFTDYYIARGLVTASGWSEARKVFSPAIVDQSDYTGWPATLAQMMIEDAKILGDVQYSLQLHKLLWPNSKVER